MSVKRILVVDDDRMLADTLREMIRASVPSGVDVEIATGGAKAAALLESGAVFDLVLCDLVMPGMGGIELFKLLERNGSPMTTRLVLVTGGAFTEATAAFLAKTRIPRLNKPFDLAQLRALLAATLGADPPGKP
jgi:CheY-like chemotaxis protein